MKNLMIKMETTYEIALTFLTEGSLTDRKRKTLDFFGIPYPPKKIIKHPKDLLIWNKRKRKFLGLPLNVNINSGGIDFVREIIRIRDKHTCQKCFKKWKKSKRRFDVHHLDINQESKKDINYDRNNIDKMITLCHKCHLNLHTVKEKMRKKVIHI